MSGSKKELEDLIDRVNELELARAADAPRRQLHAAEGRVAMAVMQAMESDWMRALTEAVEADYARRLESGEGA